jgi:hypothetical protein
MCVKPEVSFLASVTLARSVAQGDIHLSQVEAVPGHVTDRKSSRGSARRGARSRGATVTLRARQAAGRRSLAT